MLRSLIRVAGVVLRLSLLAAAVLGYAAFLLVIGGPPRPPARWPGLDEVALSLQLGGPTNDVLLYLLTQALWLLLGYLALLVLVELVVTGIETLAAGARGVGRLRGATDRLAPAIVRQAVAALVSTLLVLGTAKPTPTTVAAPVAISRTFTPEHLGAPVEPGPAAPTAARPAAPAPAVVLDADGGLRLATRADRLAAEPGAVRHRVERGDNLADLALRYYGDASGWPAIWEANQGRTLARGRVFDDPSLILPGETLVIPARPGSAPVEVVEHVVRPGDTLKDIARRYLGDETAWPVIYRNNQGRPAPNGEVLTNPDLIWPGMVLRFPRPIAPAAQPASAPPAAPAAPPAAERETPEAGLPDTGAAVQTDGVIGIADPGAPPDVVPTAASRPALDPAAEEAAAREAWARLQDEAEAEAHANAGAAARPNPAASPEPVAPPPASAPAESEHVAAPEPQERPAEPTPAPAVEPIGAADLPLAGLAATAALLAATLGYRELRRRLMASREPDARLLPFRLPAPPAVDPATGLAAQPLAPQAAQRRRGVEADPRHAVATLVLEALAQAGWPDAQVVSLCDGAEQLTLRLRLGAPPPADLDPLLEAIEDAIDAMIEAEAGERGEVALTLRDLSPEQAWRAGFRLPSAPLATVGLAGGGLLSVALDALGGGLLLSGDDAAPALERALLSLVALYPPADLRVALLAGGPLAADLAGLPHLMRPPVAPSDLMAKALLAELRDELRARQAAAGDEAGELILLVVDGPAAVDGPVLRELVRDGAEVGIYALLAAADAADLDGALLAACPGRLVTRLADDEAGQRLAGRAGAAALAPGAAWWRLAGEPARPVRLLRMAPDDRRELLAGMADAAAEAATARGRSVPSEAEQAAPEPSEREPVGPAALPASDDQVHHNGHNGHNGKAGVDELAALAPLAVAPPDGTDAGNGHQPTLPMAVTPPTRPAPDEVTARTEPAAPSVDGAAAQPEPASRLDPTIPPSAAAVVAGSIPGQPRAHSSVGADRADALEASEDEDEDEDEPGPPVPEPATPHGPRPGMLLLRLFGAPRLVDGWGEPVTLGRGLLYWKLLLVLGIQGETGAIAARIHAAAWSRLDAEDDADDFAEDDGAQARAIDKVQKAVRRLRGMLVPSLPPSVASITCRGGVYRLNPDAIWTDAGAVAACLAEARRLPDPAALPLLRAALDYYAAPLAEEIPAGWFDPVWLDQERAHWGGEARRATLWAAAVLARGGDYAGAAATFARLRALFIVDDEAAERELICQALRGEPEMLRRNYQEHGAAMARLGMLPNESTRRLFEQLGTGQITAEMRQRVFTSGRR